MKIIDTKKQPDYIKSFSDTSIVVVGAGAVGSLVVEGAIKMGIDKVTIIDFDPLENANLSKSSSLYRYPDDVGENKAVALAKRANELTENNNVKGINSNITNFGPAFFATYDAILLALDNYAAKIYANQMWKQIPDSERPILIMGGTDQENAQSTSLDGFGPCLRCTFSEGMLENSLVRTSCTGAEYRDNSYKGETSKTTGLASRNAANFMIEQLRAGLLGIKESVDKMISYTAFPNLFIRVSRPLVRKDCPDCKNYQPPNSLTELKNCNVISLTLEELFERIEKLIGTNDFSISVPKVEFAGKVYYQIIKDDYCKFCGQKIEKFYRHEFKTSYEDVLCEKCKNQRITTNRIALDNQNNITLDTLVKNECDEKLLNKTLFDLGWPIGGYIEVVIRNEDCIDITDDGFREDRVFYCSDDQLVLDKIY